MVFDLIQVLLAAAFVALVPGWFWAKWLLSPSSDRAERLAFSIALSMGLVSALALLQSFLFSGGVTLPVAVSSSLIVFALGFVAYRRLGFAGKEAADPPPPENRLGRAGRLLRRFALPAVMAVVAVRGYIGVVLYDWPYIRGIDQYIQSVMVNLVLSGEDVDSFMVYPPGFHALLASVSRLSGLGPLEIFPVLGPAFLLLPPLALYALAKSIWGWQVGVAAAFFSGVVLTSSYQYVIEARYLHLSGAQFFLVLTIAAFLKLLGSPSVRSGALFAVLGSSVVLYHPVSSLYTALLLALVSAVMLPYLLLISEERRRAGVVLFASLAALGTLSVIYAWGTYDLGDTALGFLMGSSGGATSASVSGALGTQQPYELSHLPFAVSGPVLLLGIAGIVLLILDRRGTAGQPSIPYASVKFTLIAWAAIMFAGSRTPVSGFPERFERDLGVPLALLAAFAFIDLTRFLFERKSRPPARLLAALVAVVMTTYVGLQTFLNLQVASAPQSIQGTAAISETSRISMTPQLEAAGDWLADSNTGGNIISSPYLEGLPSRAMLAMGGYSSVQTFSEDRIQLNRDLPPSGQGPPRDAFIVLDHPSSDRAREVLLEYDIRYVVLSKYSPLEKWRAFEQDPALYRKAFENESVVIFAPRTVALRRA